MLDERCKMEIGFALLGLLICSQLCTAEPNCLPEVDISSPPQTPGNLSCVNYNWKNLTCYLLYGTHYRSSEISITWEWTVGHQWGRCPKLNTTSTQAVCFWLSAHVGEHTFRINITNNLRRSDPPVTKMFKINPPVEPDKVTNITSMANSTYASLTWGHSSGSKNLLYNIHYCSRWDSCKEMQSKHRRVVLLNLVPDTEYNVSIVARPFYNNCVTGYTSSPAYINFTTQTDVPLYNPKMQPGFYETINSTAIIVYWKNIPEKVQNGRIQLYNATSFLLENGTQILTVPKLFSTVKHTNTSENFLSINGLCSTCKYRVELALKNMKGYSHNDSSQLYLLPLLQRPVVKHIGKFTVEAMNDTFVRIMWLDQSQPYATTVKSITNYSIVWCRRNNNSHLCKGELQDKVVRKSVNELEINLKSSFRDYRFGMSVEVDTTQGLLVSSGIEWGTSVPFLKYGVPNDAPPDVEIELTEPRGFNTTWGPYEANSPDHSPAVAYQVIYCSKYNCTAVNITASDSMMKFTITSLSPGPYNCTVRGIFPGGYGPMSTSSKLVVGLSVNMAASVSGEGDNSVGIIIGVVAGVILLIIIAVLVGVKFRNMNHKAYIATKEIEVPEVDKGMAETSGQFQGNSIDSGVVEDSKYSSDDDPTRVALLPQKANDLSDLQIKRTEPCKAPLIQQDDPQHVHSSKNSKENVNSAVTSGIGSGVSGSDLGQTLDTGQTLSCHQSQQDNTLYKNESADHSNGQFDAVDDGYRRPTFADSSSDSQYSPVIQDSVESYTQPTIS
ncbi:uncharacterized protein LOC117324907 isoform X2 [Pecten maximus]|uniref:uncharacterized protein LOC117324907 isoform X2 n=1 Tax=Pecten maximus TaxID=6579 RepID=UPI001458A621|nr:uncharacterized protein LOC117324907 isoform X2 [Pecten maximus]